MYPSFLFALIEHYQKALINMCMLSINLKSISYVGIMTYSLFKIVFVVFSLFFSRCAKSLVDVDSDD